MNANTREGPSGNTALVVKKVAVTHEGPQGIGHEVEGPDTDRLVARVTGTAGGVGVGRRLSRETSKVVVDHPVHGTVVG